MSTSPILTRWQLPDLPGLVVRRYPTDGEYLVFNETSGDVHLLTAAAIAILDRLSGGSASLVDLCPALDTDDPGAVEAAVRELDRLGLIHPELP